MSKKARLTEKHMLTINEVRNIGFSWRDVQKHMKTIYHLNHTDTTYMRHYKKWKGPETYDGFKKPSLWERIKSFFGA